MPNPVANLALVLLLNLQPRPGGTALAGAILPPQTGAGTLTPPGIALPSHADAVLQPLTDAEPPAGAGPRTIGLAPVGQLGGSMLDVAVRGTLAYVAMGPRVAVWDVADPARPTWRGASQPLPGLVWRVALDGGRVFATTMSAADGHAAVHALSLDDPFRPERVASFRYQGDPAVLAAAGGRLAVSIGEGGVRFVDTARPGRFDVGGSAGRWASGVVIKDNLAFVAHAGRSRLLVIDIADPSRPQPVDDFLFPAGLVTAQGSLVFGARDREFLVADASNPKAMRIVGQTVLALEDVRGIVAAGGTVLVAGDRGVQVVDVRDPVVPLPGAVFGPTFGSAQQVDVAGRTAFVAGATRGLWVYDLGILGAPDAPGAPPLIAQVDLLADVRAVTPAGDVVFVANGHGGIWVVDAADPADPRPSARLGLPEVQSIATEGDRAYCAASRTGLWTLDISDPLHPAALSLFRTPDEVTDVAPAGDVVYLAGGRAGIRVTDVSDPRRPRFIGAYEDLPDEPGGLALSGGHLFVAAGTAGLRVFDVADPARLREVAVFNAPEDAADVAVVDGAAFVAYAGAGVRVFDVTRPDRPRLADSLFIAGTVSLSAGPGHVAVAAGRGGIRVLERGGDGRWRLASIGGATGGHTTRAVAVGSYWYATDGAGGLAILKSFRPWQAYLPRAEWGYRTR